MSEVDKCDVCGAPATNLARDVWRHEPPESAWADYTVIDILKKGCQKHPATSQEFVTHLPRVKETT